MISHFVAARRFVVSSALAFAALVSWGSPSNAAPTAAKLDDKNPVTVSDSGDSWVLDNGIVKASINKKSGRMRSLIYKGIETMGRNGGGVEAEQFRGFCARHDGRDLHPPDDDAIGDEGERYKDEELDQSASRACALWSGSARPDTISRSS